jgi:hypothetical protein
MSQTVVFSVGAIIFAIVVYGTVIAGGLALGRQERLGRPTPEVGAPGGGDTGTPERAA